MKIIWEWKPNSNLGPIKLGDQISHYKKRFHLIDDEKVDKTDWIGYRLTSVDTFIYVENGIIVSICTYEEFIFKGKNLIGTEKGNLINIIGCEPDEVGESVLYDDGDIQTPFEYFDLGLQLWVSNEVVVSASCVNYQQ